MIQNSFFCRSAKHFDHEGTAMSIQLCFNAQKLIPFSSVVIR